MQVNKRRWQIYHTIDIITALAQAGLRIESLEEFPDQAEWRFGAQV